MEARRDVQHASGIEKCSHQNAEYGSRRSWTTRLLRAGPGDANAETSGQAAGGSGPSSSSGPALAAGSPAPEDANIEVIAESSAAQRASSAARTLEAEDQSSAKRQIHAMLAGIPTLHESDEEVNVDAYKNIVLAGMPDDREQWTQQVIDWGKKYYGAKSGTLLETQKVYEGRLRELADTEKLEVAEPIPLQEARAQNLEIIYRKWLDDKKGTPEDKDAVRSRLAATQVNTYAREGVMQATPPINGSRITVSQAATKTNAKGQHDCLIGRHDIRVAFFHAKGSGQVVIIPPKGLEVPDTLINEGTKPVVVVVPMMFVSESHGDDFVTSGSAAAADEVDRVLTTHFDTKILPRIGPTAYGGEVSEGKHLCRTIRWSPQGLTVSTHLQDSLSRFHRPGLHKIDLRVHVARLHAGFPTTYLSERLVLLSSRVVAVPT